MDGQVSTRKEGAHCRLIGRAYVGLTESKYLDGGKEIPLSNSKGKLLSSTHEMVRSLEPGKTMAVGKRLPYQNRVCVLGMGWGLYLRHSL